MIEIHYEMSRYNDYLYGDRINEIHCCDCFYDKVYFLLRQNVDGEYFEKRFEKNDDCFIAFFDGIIIVVCNDILIFIRYKYELAKKHCIKDVIWCLKNKTILCSICTIELFRKIKILHLFKLK